MFIITSLILAGIAALLVYGIAFVLRATVRVIKDLLNELQGTLVIGHGSDLKGAVKEAMSQGNRVSEEDFLRATSEDAAYIAEYDEEADEIKSIRFAESIAPEIKKYMNRSKNGTFVINRT